MSKINVTSPVGRLVRGSLYTPQDKDMSGAPLVVKRGPNAGQPTKKYFFALAIPKGAETHWTQTEWGTKMLQTAQSGFPQGQWQTPTFSWKTIDGDSKTPNANGKIPSNNEGYPGNWIINFQSGFPPKIYNRDGTAAIVEPNAVKLGYFIQVNFDVEPNGEMAKPGIYVNSNMVALSAYGPEIHVGPDVAAAGFGGAPLPAGASATPLAPVAAPFAAPLGTQPLGVPPGQFPGTTAPPASPSNPAFLQVPPPMAPVAPAPAMAAPPPPAPPAPPAPTGPVMTPAAGGVTYAQYVASGWNDAQLRAAGLML